VFQTLDDAIAVLQQPYQPASYAQGLSRVQATLDGALNNMVMMRSGVGTELQRVDSASAANAQDTLNMEQRRSDLQDLDFSQAISELQSNQTSMQAAMQAYASVAKTSLFQLLG
jgi:flagellar hook-associated protein 3 FlgL